MSKFLSFLVFIMMCGVSFPGMTASNNVADWQVLNAAQKSADAGQWDEVRKQAESLQVSPPLDFWREVLLARAAAAGNNAARVKELLQTLPREPDPSENTTESFYETLYKQALTLKKDAVKLWALFPDPQNPSAPVPAGATLLDKIARLHSLHEAKAFEGVKGLVSAGEIESSELSQEAKCHSLFELGNSLRQLKDSDGALAAFAKGGQQSCGDSWAPKSLYWKGKIEAGLKNFSASLETFRTLAREFPNGNYADDALDSIRKIYHEQHDATKEAAAREALIRHGEGDMRNALLWDEAFDSYESAIKSKNPDEGLKKTVVLLDQELAGKDPGDESRPQALYWKARSIERMKKGGGSSVARAAYHRVMEEYPLSYYALLAGARLGTMPGAVAFSSPSTGTGEAGSLVSVLAGKGLHDQARMAADLITRTGDLSAEEKIKLWTVAHGYYEALDLAGRKMGTGIRGPLDHTSDPLMSVLYPVAFGPELSKAAGSSGLARGFILGITREESLFRPAIVSHAGAVGLMQLMPATARIQAGQIGASGSLEDPAHNYLLGASFFKKMRDQYDSVPLAIMAYNAGPGNVNKWLRANGSLPLDEFVEAIPFSETRNYVKRVMRSMRIFGSLLHEPEFSKPFFKLKIH